MTTLTDTEYAIFSTDVYNNKTAGQRLGDAVVLDIPFQFKDSFYATAYKIGNEIIISYRGTDNPPVDGFAYLMGGGNPFTSQAFQAVEFYKQVLGLKSETQTIVTTGHSLGGGLAGFVAGLFGLDARIFDSMAYYGAVQEAYRLATLTFSFDVKELFWSGVAKDEFYNNETPPAPNYDGIESYSIKGQVLGFNEDKNDAHEPFPLGNNDHGHGLNVLELHSAGLLAIRMFAEETGISGVPINDSWKTASAKIFPNLFNDDIARAAGFTQKGTFGEHDEMIGAIANSALVPRGADPEVVGVFPNGNAAIGAFYSGMIALSDAIALGITGLGTPAAISDWRANWDKNAYGPLSQIITQYAAALAKNSAVTLSNAYPSVLSVDYQTDQVVLDLSEDTWRMNGSMTQTIVGRDSLIGLIGQEMAINLESLLALAYGRQGNAAIDHVVFATGYEEYSQKFAPGDLGPLKTLFIGTGGPDDITGSEGNDSIYAGALNQATESGGTIIGGAGSDILIGTSAEDILLGGDGLDILIGGSGGDTLDGGGGNWLDILLGGDGLNIFKNFGAGLAVGGADTDIFDYELLGSSFVAGGSGSDTFNIEIDGYNGFTIVWGGEGQDTFNVTSSRHVNILALQSADITMDLAARLSVGAYGVFDENNYQSELGLYLSSYDIIYVNPDQNDKLFLNGQEFLGAYSEIVYEYVDSDIAIRQYERVSNDGLQYYTYRSDGLNALTIEDELTIYGAYQGIFGIYLDSGVRYEMYSPGSFEEQYLRIRQYFDDDWQDEELPEFNFADYTIEKAAARFEAEEELEYLGLIGVNSDYIEGTEGDDNLEGTSRSNYFYSAGGDDRVYGYEGNDTIEAGSGAGNDFYDGGADIDTIIYPSTSLGITLDLAAGTAQGAEIDEDILVGIENVAGGSGDDNISGDDGINILSGAEGGDSLYGRGGNDILIGGIGADLLDGGEGEDAASYRHSDQGLTVNLVNTATNTGEAAGDSFVSIENIIGSDFDDVLTGNELANRIDGGKGTDMITGALGDDELLGSKGSDLYFWASGDGNDVIIDIDGDSADIDILHLQGVAPSDVAVTARGTSLFLAIAGAEVIELRGQLLENGTGVETVKFDTGETWNRSDLIANAVRINSAPELTFVLSDQSFDEGTAVDFQLPPDAFNDVDGDTLALSVSLSDGSVLPDWLTFDQASTTFSGQPPEGFYGSLDILVTANDGEFESSGNFSLNIVFVNDAPFVNTAIEDHVFEAGKEISFALAENTFVDPDGHTPWISATLANGSELPAWLSFSPYGLSFVGSAPQDFSGAVEIRVAATDGQYEAHDTFTLEITAPINSAPILANRIADQSSLEDAAFSFQVPSDTFTDADGDALVFSATLTDGSALPTWLVFDDATLTFSGTPPLDFNGSIDVRITAGDGAENVSDDFVLEITPVNDAPVAGDDGVYAAVAGATLSIAAEDLLANDTDADNDALSIVSVSNGAHGQVSIGQDGSVLYAADAGFSGNDSFTYQVSDGTTTSEATVSVSVLNPVDPYEGWRHGTDGSDLLFGKLFSSNQIYGAGGNDLITGGLLADELDGGAGNDIIVGLSGSDRITGGSGTDVLVGGAGNDTFFFGEGFGTDIIADFFIGSSGGDFIEIDIDGVTNFEDLMGFAHQDGSDTVFDFGDGDLLILKNTQLAALDNDAFSIV